MVTLGDLHVLNNTLRTTLYYYYTVAYPAGVRQKKKKNRLCHSISGRRSGRLLQLFRYQWSR